MTTYRTGCAGWAYDDWNGPFYARGTPPGDYLAAYARVFDSVEIDATYYRAPTRAQCARWADATPDSFQFFPKVPEAVVRDRLAGEVEEEVAAFRDALEPLRRAGKLGAVLAQFPPSFRADKHADRLGPFVDLFRGDRLAVELRHASWWRPRTYRALEDRGAALAWSWTQYGVTPPEVTAPWTYVRLIGDRELTRFDRVQRDMGLILRDAKDRLRAAAEQLDIAIVIANNHFAGHAPATLAELRALLGLPPVDTARAARGRGQRGLGEY